MIICCVETCGSPHAAPGRGLRKCRYVTTAVCSSSLGGSILISSDTHSKSLLHLTIALCNFCSRSAEVIYIKSFGPIGRWILPARSKRLYNSSCASHIDFAGRVEPLHERMVLFFVSFLHGLQLSICSKSLLWLNFSNAIVSKDILTPRLSPCSSRCRR